MEIGDIGGQIKEARKKLGWSQKQLAAEARVTEQTVVNIELGHHKPNWKTIEKIAGAIENAHIS